MIKKSNNKIKNKKSSKNLKKKHIELDKISENNETKFQLSESKIITKNAKNI